MIETILPLLVSACLAAPSPATGPQLFLDQAPSTPDSVRVTAFLDLLATAWTPLTEQGGYDPTRAGSWDVPRVASFFAPGGVTFHDVNGDTTWHVDARVLRHQLDQRRGPAFDMLLHLGYIYDLRYPQYARLSFKRQHDGVVTTVGTAGWYRVTFVRHGGLLRVARVEYLEVEDK
jgi:hypothetical protein